MRFFIAIFAYLPYLAYSQCIEKTELTNNCITFSVAAGTGCQWMCNYCEQNLGTTNYYFADGVCKYETGGCVGSPMLGEKYTCCSNV